MAFTRRAGPRPSKLAAEETIRMNGLLPTISHNMFHMPLPILEKILRPVIVYVFLIGFLRLFGKRELAQLNPFDLVVLLSLSNTVQNAMIGDDNSVSGGLIGAFALLAINWLLMWVLYRAPKVNTALEGSATTLITDGVVDKAALRKETLTDEELISILNKNGFDDPGEVATCVLEPNGTFFVKGKTPSTETVHSSALMAAVEKLTAEVKSLRAEMESKGHAGA
jgi:uncharacterized membrane protein YcaP (DUF421 family)